MAIIHLNWMTTKCFKYSNLERIVRVWGINLLNYLCSFLVIFSVSMAVTFTRRKASISCSRSLPPIGCVIYYSSIRKVWETWCCSAWRRRLRGDIIVAFQYLKGAYRKDGHRLFSRACCKRTRGNGFKLKAGRFRLDISKKFFAVRVVKHWTGCPERW